MKTCFVSMPLGIKIDPSSGKDIDFDRIYYELIAPAIVATENRSFRMDDAAIQMNMQRTVIESVINSDIMISDLTTLNPNVMYELGMRHIAQRGLTIMICASGTSLPFNISSSQVISYKLNEDGTVSDGSKQAFQQLLRYSIESSLDQIVTDSPVYQFFPGISISLPVELTMSQSKLQMLNSNRRKPAILSSLPDNQESIQQLKKIQSEALDTPEEVDPIDFLNILKKYRDMSAWEDLVGLVEKIPDNLKKNPDVQQLYALSLNRIGEQEKAISTINTLIQETGGDAESYGILGRIYKDKYEISKESNDATNTLKFLDEAIDNYKLGFEKQPDDFYTGVNVVTLLIQRNDQASREELQIVLPRVRTSLKNKMADSIPDYWAYATAIELSCIAGEWAEAEQQAKFALSLNPSPWMVETTIRNLKMNESNLDIQSRILLTKLISSLQQNESMPQEGLPDA